MKERKTYDQKYAGEEYYWGTKPSTLSPKVLEFLSPKDEFHPRLLDIGCGEDRHLGGIPIKIERMYTEAATMQKRALFDRDDFARKLYQILKMNEKDYDKLCKDAKLCADQYFSWDKTAKIWERVLDEISLHGNKDWVNEPKTLYNSTAHARPPESLHSSAEAMIRWCIDNWYPHPYFTEFRIQELTQCVITGANFIDQFNRSPYSFNQFMKEMDARIEKHNVFEGLRCSSGPAVDTGFKFVRA